MGNKLLTNRLLSGIVIFRLQKSTVHVKPALVEDKALADFYAQEAYEDAILEGVLTSEKSKELLVANDLWDDEKDKLLEKLEKNLDQMKVDYFSHFYKEDARKYIKSSIDSLKVKIQELKDIQYLFFDKTCEYVRDYTRTCYIVEKTAFLPNGDLATKSMKLIDIINTYLACSLKDDDIRDFSKTGEWRYIWNSKESGIFNQKACELNHDQLSLLAWSQYYDGVHESIDKPSDDIINDNLALEGWNISQIRKRKEEQKKQDGEKMLSDKMSGAGEVFIPVKTKKDTENVLALNDGYGKSVLKSKKQQFKKGGVFNESELNHVKQEMRMESLRLSKERGM
jgi:hypothetical protein